MRWRLVQSGSEMVQCAIRFAPVEGDRRSWIDITTGHLTSILSPFDRTVVAVYDAKRNLWWIRTKD